VAPTSLPPAMTISTSLASTVVSLATPPDSTVWLALASSVTFEVVP
jgi:hypothetical protein